MIDIACLEVEFFENVVPRVRVFMGLSVVNEPSSVVLSIAGAVVSSERLAEQAAEALRLEKFKDAIEFFK